MWWIIFLFKMFAVPPFSILFYRIILPYSTEHRNGDVTCFGQWNMAASNVCRFQAETLKASLQSPSSLYLPLQDRLNYVLEKGCSNSPEFWNVLCWKWKCIRNKPYKL